MSLSFSIWRFLKSSRLSPNYIICYIGIFKSTSISCMEISVIFGANYTSQNIACFQRCGHKILIFSCRRQDARLTSSNSSNFTNFHIFSFISNNISWLQRINRPRCLEIDICDISIVHAMVIFIFGSIKRMRSCFCAFNVIDVHYISCAYFKLLLFNWSWSWNIVNILLIPDKFDWFSL